MRNYSIISRYLLAILGGFPSLVIGACSSTPVVDVVLQDPYGRRAYAKYAQLVIFDNGCPDRTKLANGDVSGYRWMQSVEVDGNFNEIGTLDKAPYGFAAILRDDYCGVIGFGCTPVDLSHHRHIAIAVNEEVSPPRGSCDTDQVCANSVCIAGNPTEEDADTEEDIGPLNCEFDIIASGNFDLPATASTVYSGPVVVATSNGFVIMYREAEPSGLHPVGVRLKVTDQGNVTRNNINLPACAQNNRDDGIAAAWNGSLGAGLMAVALPSCGPENAQLHVSNFDRDGKTLADHQYKNVPAPLHIHPINAMAPAPASKNFLLATMQGPVPLLFVFNGITVQGDPPPSEIHKGNGKATFTQISSSESIRSLLTDSDLDDGKILVSVVDISTGSESMTDFEHSPITSLVSWSERTVVAQPSGDSLVWKAITKSGSSIKSGTLDGGPYTSVGSAQLHDYLLLAGAKKGAITMFRIDDANGTFSGSPFQSTLSSSFGLSAIEGFQGERIGIAAARKRVVVAWITSTVPMANTSTAPGGFAVLACRG
jgi:hypothetical protein